MIGLINALSVKLSANATVRRVGSVFANIGILSTARRAGFEDVSSIFRNTGWTLFLITRTFANGWQSVFDGWMPYAATHVDAANAMEKISWNLFLRKLLFYVVLSASKQRTLKKREMVSERASTSSSSSSSDDDGIYFRRRRQHRERRRKQRKHARERQRDISRGEAFVEKVFLDPSHSSSFLQASWERSLSGNRYLFVVSVFFLIFFWLALKFRVFNPSLFDETNFRKFTTNTFARQHSALYFFNTRAKRERKSLGRRKKRTGRAREVIFSASWKECDLFWFLRVVSVN